MYAQKIVQIKILYLIIPLVLLWLKIVKNCYSRRRFGLTESEWLDLFKNRLVSRMEETNTTQRKLADMTDLSVVTINNYINKRKLPGVKAVINLAHALDCSVDDLVDFCDMIQ